MLPILGYFLALLIGFSLCLIGGGGSILVIPLLVFFFGIEPVLATTYALFIVGFTALSGAVSQSRMYTIDYKTVAIFGIPSVIVLYVMRHWLLGLIPAELYRSGSFVITKSLLVMMVFSILMILAGISMIRQKKYAASPATLSRWRLAVQGGITGAITGFIGIGGGFVIVPSLVLFAGSPMKKAITTSLIIITVNCLVGILSKPETVRSLDYFFLSTLTVVTIMGMIA